MSYPTDADLDEAHPELKKSLDEATIVGRSLGSVADVGDVPQLSSPMISDVFNDVRREIFRQDQLARAGKFGGTHVLPSGPDFARLAVLTEEVGEVARELNEALIRGDRDLPKLYAELVQVAACAVSWGTALIQFELRGVRA